MIAASYYSAAWISLFVAIIGALVVASIDSNRQTVGAMSPSRA
jgi:hypothetical protein